MATEPYDHTVGAAELHLQPSLPFAVADNEAVVRLTVSLFGQVPTIEAHIDPEEGFPYIKVIVQVSRDAEDTRRKSNEWYRRLAQLNPLGTYGLMMDFV